MTAGEMLFGSIRFDRTFGDHDPQFHFITFDLFLQKNVAYQIDFPMFRTCVKVLHRHVVVQGRSQHPNRRRFVEEMYDHVRRLHPASDFRASGSVVKRFRSLICEPCFLLSTRSSVSMRESNTWRRKIFCYCSNIPRVWIAHIRCHTETV